MGGNADKEKEAVSRSAILVSVAPPPTPYPSCVCIKVEFQMGRDLKAVFSMFILLFCFFGAFTLRTARRQRRRNAWHPGQQ